MRSALPDYVSPAGASTATRRVAIALSPAAGRSRPANPPGSGAVSSTVVVAAAATGVGSTNPSIYRR